MEGKVDYIITKSVSRFARNTLDCLNYVRKLRDKGIAVFFEKENIISTDSKGELMLTIMPSLTQQESQSISQNVTMGIQYRFQQGEIRVNHNRFLGYTKDENKKLVIVPREAEIIKRIYREFLEGLSLVAICDCLMKDNILTAADKPTWRPETVRKILMNEKYMGDALLQKTYTIDFLSKKRGFNNGAVPQYYVENSHEAIIPRDLFMQVQEEMASRSNFRNLNNGSKRCYNSKYLLSNLIICGECGEVYRRVTWANGKEKYVVWRCLCKLDIRADHCNNRTVKDKELEDALVQAINIFIDGRDTFLKMFKENVEKVTGLEGLTPTNSSLSLTCDTSAIDEKLKKLQDEIVQLATNNEDYDDLAHEINHLRAERDKVESEWVKKISKANKTMDMVEFLNNQDGLLKEYNEQIVRKLIEKITVFEDRFEIEFKSGEVVVI